ncbi:FG-GAP repeat domain-containing protein [Sedimenticola selenatireducens]|uniref:VCBS repeat-containing protein n=1 Tax=Sedimenticola selenatireducens TaxID=191960 RepID=A0A557SEF0_9GAMM|nr:VCBS repeat-containing protein [Sedimenticola selenatireducens]TVO75805.1 VCBS repeat-containing protein [Sedimenticola selenatireducens]TVT63664.1 MAG: VCBS repeat-containing protein [Sedimenticola selenatireducens]
MMLQSRLIPLLLMLWSVSAFAIEVRYIDATQSTPLIDYHMNTSLPDALPDGVVIEGAGAVKRAWLVFPTRRYDHAILGDDIEAAGIRVELATGEQLTFTLPEGSVFEDRYPRLVDLDNDGIEEIVLVRSYLDRGAALAVLKINNAGIELLAESTPIGLAHRWLNPVGAGDFDQDGQQELAVVITPHIGGVLTLYKVEGNRLQPIYQMPGFSNHRIGSRELGQSAIVDVNDDGVPDMAVPAVGFHELRLISIINGALKEINRVAHSSPIRTALEVRDLDGDGDQDLTYGLADGRQVELLLP